MSETHTRTRTRFSIITPTILRRSLARACASIDMQTFGAWQHIVMIDRPSANLPAWLFPPGWKHSRRKIIVCGTPHRDGGATCRHNAWDYADGEYVLYLDDDDFYRPDALERLDRFIRGEPFGVFPVDFCGEAAMLKLPPGECRTPICGFYHRRTVKDRPIRYPVGRGYTADSWFAGTLAQFHGWRAPIGWPGLAVVERLRSHPVWHVRLRQWLGHSLRSLRRGGSVAR